ncbi:MAG: hypothetical protein JWM80_1233 [Cyanobacteria bacterium RYN_339]|nr:hypothetical protein [Cyanobacteria bacterium RYN_339]
MALDPTSGGGGIKSPTFKEVVAKDKEIAKDFQSHGPNDPDKQAVVDRNNLNDVVTTEGFKAANAGRDQNDVNTVLAGFNAKDGDQMYSEAEFNQMQAMLDDPVKLHDVEATIKAIYKDNLILSPDRDKNTPDGAGMGAWSKRAFELMQQNPGLTAAQLKASLETEIKAAHDNPGNAAPQPRAGAGTPY